MKRKLIAISAALVAVAGLSSCGQSDADVVSYNISKAADQFEVQRRIVFFNGITDTYLMTVEGRCSLGNFDGPGQLSVTCKVEDDKYKKHFLGLSDNVSYFVEQLDGKNVSKNHYRVVFKPSTIIPDIDLR